MTEPQKQPKPRVSPILEHGEHPLVADPVLGQSKANSGTPTSQQSKLDARASTINGPEDTINNNSALINYYVFRCCGALIAIALLGFYSFEFISQAATGRAAKNQFVPTLSNTISSNGASSSQTALSTEPVFSKKPLANGHQASVHGATLTPTQSGWLAAWYGGTREGAKDVQLFTTRTTTIDSNNQQMLTSQQWTPPQAILSRTELGEQLGRYVKKLGNPMLYTTEDGNVWLFFVSVSVGGWAGSAVNVMVSSDGGASFSPPRRLTTSPFFNVSTLVRNRPISLANGGMVIPIYHEFMGKFCELLWLDAEGNITDKQRLSWGRHTLQPSIVAKDEHTAAVFMRISAPKTHIEVATTQDGGQTFSKPSAINLPNANAAIDASLLPNNDWLLVYNHDPIGRDKLALATASSPTGQWHKRTTIEQHQPETGYRRFAYPAIVAADGQYQLLYTVERSFIQSVNFNAHWLEQLSPPDSSASN